MSEIERIEATDKEKAAAFEWLRGVALELAPYSMHAAIALQEWRDAQTYADARIRAIEVQEGDVLVYSTEENLDRDQAEVTRQILARAFPGVQVLVVDAGAELQTFRPPQVLADKAKP